MKKILIVSTSSSFIERNGTLLRRSDFRILAAASAADAMKLVVQESVDLLLIDIQLADMDGEVFCSLVRNNREIKTPVMLLVCHDSEEDFVRLKPSGADALIARPIKPLQLIKTVGQFLTVQLVRSRRVSLRVKVMSKKDPIEFFCISHNISITGMLIETEYFLEIGSIILCQFTIPGSIQIETEGEVVRSARTMDGAHQYGIRFTTLTRPYRQEIDHYIAAIVRGDRQPVA
jgi:CheY-like chemotaxis protein